MNVFVVVSAAIPTADKFNALASKVSAACVRASKADTIANIVKLHDQDSIVYGLQCKIITSVVSMELAGDLSDYADTVYVLLTAAIPLQRRMNPIQTNVHSVYVDRNKAEEVFRNLSGKNITVNGIACQCHVSIVPTKLDRS